MSSQTMSHKMRQRKYNFSSKKGLDEPPRHKVALPLSSMCNFIICWGGSKGPGRGFSEPPRQKIICMYKIIFFFYVYVYIDFESIKHRKRV